MNRKFGQPISQLRKQWRAEGKCPRCGGILEPGYGACLKCRRSKNARNVIKRERAADTKPVLVNMPRDILAKIEADAKDRGESIEQWIIAECRAAFDEGEDQ